MTVNIFLFIFVSNKYSSFKLPIVQRNLKATTTKQQQWQLTTYKKQTKQKALDDMRKKLVQHNVQKNKEIKITSNTTSDQCLYSRSSVALVE